MLIEVYMHTPFKERQAHLRLKEKCIERGGTSVNFLGLLADYLHTTVPCKGPKKVCLCHACNNPKCSNPRHLYWGTAAENVADAQRAGTHKSIWQRMIEKYGSEEAAKAARYGPQALTVKQ